MNLENTEFISSLVHAECYDEANEAISRGVGPINWLEEIAWVGSNLFKAPQIPIRPFPLGAIIIFSLL